MAQLESRASQMQTEHQEAAARCQQLERAHDSLHADKAALVTQLADLQKQLQTHRCCRASALLSSSLLRQHVAGQVADHVSLWTLSSVCHCLFRRLLLH